MKEEAAGDEDDDDEDDDDEEGTITEFRFVPSDAAARESEQQRLRAGQSVSWDFVSTVFIIDLLSGRCVSAVQSMFSAMCECQALHPDPEDDDSDSDFEGEEYDLEEAGEEDHTHTQSVSGQSLICSHIEMTCSV